MAAGATYEPIATTTLGSAAASITFSSISAAYTDLRVVLANAKVSALASVRLTYNSNATGYSFTQIKGNGTAAGSDFSSNNTYIDLLQGVYLDTTIPGFIAIDVFSYAGSTYKTCLINSNIDWNGSGAVIREVGLWQNTAAITSLTITTSSGTLNTGTTATLYGILKA